MQPPADPIVDAQAHTYEPGEEAPSFVPGDFVLTHGRAWTSRLIRFGQRLRYRGEDRKYAFWNHAALIVDVDGDIIEALGAGVVRRNLAVYQPTEYTVVRIDQLVGAPADRDQAVAFALSTEGQRYGFAVIASIAWGLLTGGAFTFAYDGQHICSGLVARSLERTSAIFNRTPSHIMPADLAKYFLVSPPAGLERGTPPPRR
jgi:hypothetical protein